jgi:hypothetical protein
MTKKEPINEHALEETIKATYEVAKVFAGLADALTSGGKGAPLQDVRRAMTQLAGYAVFASWSIMMFSADHKLAPNFANTTLSDVFRAADRFWRHAQNSGTVPVSAFAIGPEHVAEMQKLTFPEVFVPQADDMTDLSVMVQLIASRMLTSEDWTGDNDKLTAFIGSLISWMLASMAVARNIDLDSAAFKEMADEVVGDTIGYANGFVSSLPDNISEIIQRTAEPKGEGTATGNDDADLSAMTPAGHA